MDNLVSFGPAKHKVYVSQNNCVERSHSSEYGISPCTSHSQTIKIMLQTRQEGQTFCANRKGFPRLFLFSHPSLQSHSRPSGLKSHVTHSSYRALTFLFSFTRSVWKEKGSTLTSYYWSALSNKTKRPPTSVTWQGIPSASDKTAHLSKWALQRPKLSERPPPLCCYVCERNSF